MKRKTGRAAVSMELELLSGNNALYSYNGHHDYNGHYGHYGHYCLQDSQHV